MLDLEFGQLLIYEIVLKGYSVKYKCIKMLDIVASFFFPIFVVQMVVTKLVIVLFYL